MLTPLLQVDSSVTYDWSMDVEHHGRFKSDFGHASEDEDTDLDNEITKGIMNSAGNPTRTVASQTVAVGTDALRQQRWVRFMQQRNNPEGWDPIEFLRRDPPILEPGEVTSILTLTGLYCRHLIYINLDIY